MYTCTNVDNVISESLYRGRRDENRNWAGELIQALDGGMSPPSTSPHSLQPYKGLVMELVICIPSTDELAKCHSTKICKLVFLFFYKTGHNF